MKKAAYLITTLFLISLLGLSACTPDDPTTSTSTCSIPTPLKGSLELTTVEFEWTEWHPTDPCNDPPPAPVIKICFENDGPAAASPESAFFMLPAGMAPGVQADILSTLPGVNWELPGPISVEGFPGVDSAQEGIIIVNNLPGPDGNGKGIIIINNLPGPDGNGKGIIIINNLPGPDSSGVGIIIDDKPGDEDTQVKGIIIDNMPGEDGSKGIVIVDSIPVSDTGAKGIIIINGLPGSEDGAEGIIVVDSMPGTEGIIVVDSMPGADGSKGIIIIDSLPGPGENSEGIIVVNGKPGTNSLSQVMGIIMEDMPGEDGSKGIVIQNMPADSSEAEGIVWGGLVFGMGGPEGTQGIVIQNMPALGAVGIDGFGLPFGFEMEGMMAMMGQGGQGPGSTMFGRLELSTFGLPAEFQTGDEFCILIPLYNPSIVPSDPGGNFNVDSFFDVFTDLTVGVPEPGESSNLIIHRTQIPTPPYPRCTPTPEPETPPDSVPPVTSGEKKCPDYNNKDRCKADPKCKWEQSFAGGPFSCKKK